MAQGLIYPLMDLPFLVMDLFVNTEEKWVHTHTHTHTHKHRLLHFLILFRNEKS